VREILYKYSRGNQATQDGAWRRVASEQPLHNIVHVYNLYVLCQVIPTQSADVERGFSLLTHILGLHRLSTSIATMDARLRVKQALPSNAMLEEDSIAWLGLHKQEAEPEDMPNAREIYEQQLKPDAPELLIRKLHHSVAMEKDAFWTETFA
jgi:hypothetical protein